MKSFASDNNSGVHPQVLEAIQAANSGHAVAYGDDKWTMEAENVLRTVFGEDIMPYFVFNGTGANVVSLQVSTRSFHSIICASSSHILVDECGSPTKMTSCQLREIQTPDGKLTPELIKPLLHGFDDQHHSQPKVIYISQVTELGTVYTSEELKALCELAHKHDMYVHMDGSRLANACAYLNTGMRELSRDCGIDILSLGGTKNGMLIGEAVIAFRPELQQYLKFYRKQSTQLYSKMRFLSTQFTAYFRNNIWLENAKHANVMATCLAEKIRSVPHLKLIQKIESNALFLTMPRSYIAELQKEYFFYVWNEERDEVRWVTSWDTTPEDIEDFVKKILSLQPQI
jgi:Threonine aldolase